MYMTSEALEAAKKDPDAPHVPPGTLILSEASIRLIEDLQAASFSHGEACGDIGDNVCERNQREEDAGEAFNNVVEAFGRLCLRGDGHADTLRGIASMGPSEGARMKQWARDGLSGYVETTDSTVKSQQDKINRLWSALEGLLSLEPNEGENANEHFERIAADFYADTGFMAPGKDPGVMVGGRDREEVREMFKRWMKDKSRAARAALFGQEESKP